ncbi:MAG: RelA/SpoT domain-containing protein [Pirellulaceae bacterium]
MASFARRFAEALEDQLSTLITSHGLTLGVPIERRVKLWTSIVEKLKRKDVKKIDSLRHLDDFVGIRLILLFKRDIHGMHRLLSKTFRVVSYEDTASRLDEAQFGYQSAHYVIALPDDWLKVPTMSEFRDLRAEVQVRTLSQHIWAAASHKLQYKREASVPFPLRRSINRVSAILETVDLELERLLDDRESYVTQVAAVSEDRVLNVDIVRAVLESKWPIQNADTGDENFSDLLDDLSKFDITTSSKLSELIDEQYDAAMEDEVQNVSLAQAELQANGSVLGTSADRTNRGVFFTLVGLTRCALARKFPHEWAEHQNSEYAAEE